MAAIQIAGLSKNFGDVPILRDINLRIEDGEFVVLVGPSGCGKSTLLRMIAGLEEITHGEIRIGERVVNHLAPKDRDVAMVFQSYALYPHMTVRENMSFSLKLRGMARREIDAAVFAASEKLEIQSLLERKPRALSGGQRQRVAMGRAMVRNPQAFLFDEPLSNLDARLREQMRYEIRKLQRDLRTTSIYVTHDQIEAMTMADRIVAMRAGIVQQVGTPAELYDDPANLFVAGFIGSPAMNFMDATLTDGGPVRLAARGAAQGSGAAQGDDARGRRVTVGIRPERIALSVVEPGASALAAASAQAGASARVAAAGLPATGPTTLGETAARIELLEPTGLGTVVHLQLSGQQLKAFTTHRLTLTINALVTLTVQPADLLLFDPDSGSRLR
jgi:multiple sugar transport system ATP-binding protein